MRARLAAAMPPTLLAAVACVQIGLTRVTPLTPWKGGGFGMFATIDGASNRTTRVFVTAPSRSEELELPPSLLEQAAACEALPTERCLARLARRIAARERQRGRPVSSVRLAVWRTDYAPVSLDPRRRLLREHVSTGALD